MIALLLAGALAAGPELPVEPIGAPVTVDTEVRRRAHALSSRLRCPVCQALSVADSQSEAALAIRARVEELVREGYTDGQITDYFVDRYGTWILLSPPAEGISWLVWAAPAVFMGIGSLVVWWTLGTGGGEAPRPPPGPGPEEADPYARRILDELEDDR